MAKRPAKKQSARKDAAPRVPAAQKAQPQAASLALAWDFWAPLLLAAVTFFVYWPTLKSDFVYDGHIEILDEGFITSLSNLPAVLSLKSMAWTSSSRIARGSFFT